MSSRCHCGDVSHKFIKNGMTFIQMTNGRGNVRNGKLVGRYPCIIEEKETLNLKRHLFMEILN